MLHAVAYKAHAFSPQDIRQFTFRVIVPCVVILKHGTPQAKCFEDRVAFQFYRFELWIHG